MGELAVVVVVRVDHHMTAYDGQTIPALICVMVRA
jgi:hypothetical protein